MKKGYIFTVEAAKRIASAVKKVEQRTARPQLGGYNKQHPYSFTAKITGQATTPYYEWIKVVQSGETYVDYSPAMTGKALEINGAEVEVDTIVTMWFAGYATDNSYKFEFQVGGGGTELEAGQYQGQLLTTVTQNSTYAWSFLKLTAKI